MSYESVRSARKRTLYVLYFDRALTSENLSHSLSLPFPPSLNPSLPPSTCPSFSFSLSSSLAPPPSLSCKTKTQSIFENLYILCRIY